MPAEEDGGREGLSLWCPGGQRIEKFLRNHQKTLKFLIHGRKIIPALVFLLISPAFRPNEMLGVAASRS